MADKKRAGIELKVIGAKQPRTADDSAPLGVGSQAPGNGTTPRTTPRGTSRPPPADGQTLSIRTFSQSGPVRRARDERANDDRPSAHTIGLPADHRASQGPTPPAPSNAPLALRFFAQTGPVRNAPAVPQSASASKPAEPKPPIKPLNKTKVSVKLACVAAGLMN